MGLKIGVCGAGAFAGSFIPLFRAHPAVQEVCIAEPLPDRRREQAKLFGIARTFENLDALCKSDVDAIAIFTQRWMHGPQAVQALKAGKHVYSAVPAAISVEEVEKLLGAAKASGLTYMVGETSYYYPSTLYCRKRFANGDFGHFVYGEAEYLHDMSVGFYEAYQHSGGADWKKTASFPPMLYPTHTVSMILSVTGARMTEVSCMGYRDTLGDGVFQRDVSMWKNELSDETALFRTSDGGMASINEFRRVGYRASPEPEVRMSLFGTNGSFETQTKAASWNTVGGELENLSEMLRVSSGISKVHDVARLPREFAGLPNGHEGSHQFLVLDFVDAIVSGKRAPNNAWFAARCCLPGIIAHQSAQQDGVLLKIPDYGDGA
jgi:predicted dehydrogenase